MKNSKAKLYKVASTLFILFLVLGITSLSAQGNPPGGATNTVDVPLDGGLLALLIGAAAYGVKKLRDKKQ